jgi:hypothetical protein
MGEAKPHHTHCGGAAHAVFCCAALDGRLRGVRPRCAHNASLVQGDDLRKKLKSEPNDVIAHCDLGIALREKGDTSGASAEFREALRLKPDDARARRFAAAK